MIHQPYYIIQGIALGGLSIYFYMNNFNYWAVGISALIALGSFGVSAEDPNNKKDKDNHSNEGDGYDTSKIPDYDTSIHKYIALVGELSSKQAGITKMYNLCVNQINENVYSNKLKVKISNEGLYMFRVIFNTLFYARLEMDGILPKMDASNNKDVGDIQRFITAAAFSTENKKPLIGKKKGTELLVKHRLFLGPLKAIKAERSDNSEINKFFTDTLILSLVGSDKNKKIDEAYNYNQVNTDYVLSGINF